MLATSPELIRDEDIEPLALERGLLELWRGVRAEG
jgi:hypothetical protein